MHPASRYLRCALLGLVSLGWALCGSAVAQEPIANARETAFKVMTYNIRYLNTRDGDDVWKNRRDKVFETLRLADVVGLQEVVRQQLGEIRQATPDFEWYGVGRDDGDLGGEMVPLGWRKSQFKAIEKGTFWLSPTPEKVGSRGWDAALPRVAGWVKLRHKASRATLLVVNTHFDHRGQEARKQSAILIREWVASQSPQLPTVLLGDLNATLDAPPLKELLREAPGQASLHNARAESPTADPGPDSTWNGFRELQPGRRIDFVLVAGSLQVSTFETLNPRTKAGRFASDHLPLLVDLRHSP